LLITYPDFENKGSAAEEMLTNPETPVGTGYSESKWVAERILDAAAERTALQPAVVRFGQVCGDGNGTWNETEWFPSLVKSALTLGCLPSLDGVSGGALIMLIEFANRIVQTVAWITAPDAAAALLEMSGIDPESDAHTLHIVHPRGVPFNTLIASAASSLNVPLVPYSEWFSKLSEEHKTQSYSETNLEKAQATNPALRLFGFFQSARIGPEWEPLSVARLETKRAVRVSNVLAESVKPLDEENVRKWLGSWRASGFLPSEQKEAVTGLKKSDEKTGIQVSSAPEATEAGPATSLPAFKMVALLKGAGILLLAYKFGFLVAFFASLRMLYSYF
jgi:thioester reductase-like protein